MRSCDGRQGEQLSILHILNLCDWKRAVSSYSLLFLQVFQLQNVGHIWSVMVRLSNIIFLM